MLVSPFGLVQSGSKIGDREFGSSPTSGSRLGNSHRGGGGQGLGWRCYRT